MTTLKEYIAADNSAAFLNESEFAEQHNLNGTICIAIVQDISVQSEVTTAIGNNPMYQGLYGERIQINTAVNNFTNIPVYGQIFYLDEKLYTVESCNNDMGMLTIQLVRDQR